VPQNTGFDNERHLTPFRRWLSNSGAKWLATSSPKCNGVGYHPVMDIVPVRGKPRRGFPGYQLPPQPRTSPTKRKNPKPPAPPVPRFWRGSCLCPGCSTPGLRGVHVVLAGILD
jgi:hypothetical protein